MRYALASMLLLLAACGQDDADNQASDLPPSPENAVQPEGEGDVSTAERLVRERLGNPEGVAFAAPQRSAKDGVPILCGTFSQDGRSQRYIVVGGEDAFVEPRMAPGEMDRAVAEFCGDGERG